MTISQILTNSVKKFKDSKIESSLLDAEILLTFVLKKNREYLITYPGKKLTKLQTTRYKLLTKKRLQGWSVAYLIGKKEFYGLEFTVNKHTLIPRPETELMVNEALSRIASWSLLKAPRGLTLIDIGTGSGCIIITIAQNQKSKIKNQKYFATDTSKEALKIAIKNAKHHKVNKYIKFLHGNLLNPILPRLSKIKNKKSIVILANLPYLTPTQIKNSPSIQKEPKSALVAGKDGLKYYRELFSQIKKLNDTLYTPCYTLCEIDPSQNKTIKSLVKKYFPNCVIDIKKDLSGKDRLAVIKLK